MARILLVDDEPLLGEELQESLEFEGFEAHYVGSARAGLAACAERSFDLVVTDLKMPEMGGLEFIRNLRDAQQTMKIIVLSGHGAETNRSEALSLGACACFAKPVDVDELADRINVELA